MFGISKHTFQSMVRDGEKKMKSRSGFFLEGDVAHVERHLGTVLGGPERKGDVRWDIECDLKHMTLDNLVLPMTAETQPF